MKRLKNNSSLFDGVPSLVKEWHPTLNGDLTPPSVQLDYPKKIWWICHDGHEWQATIKCRLKMNDCPKCEKKAAKKQIDPPPGTPIVGNQFRSNRRFKTKVTAVIEIPDSGHWVYAQLTDFSSNGLNFETEAAILPGTAIRIKIDKALGSSGLDKSLKSSLDNGCKTYNSTVQWCKKLDDDQSMSSFGIGVALI